MNIVQLIIKVAQDVGPWNLAKLVTILKANDVQEKDILKLVNGELRPYICF